MKKKMSIPLSLALLWIVIRVSIFTLGLTSQIKIGIFINLFFILAVIILAFHLKIKKEKKLNGYASNFKFCMKNASIYVIIVMGYSFVHHKYVDPGYLKSFHIQRMNTEYEKVKNYEMIQKNTPSIQHKTKEEYLADAKNVSQIFTGVSFITSIYFGFLFFLSFFYSIITPLFYKKVILRM